MLIGGVSVCVHARTVIFGWRSRKDEAEEERLKRVAGEQLEEEEAEEEKKKKKSVAAASRGGRGVAREGASPARRAVEPE